jgi:hypothetical protein
MTEFIFHSDRQPDVEALGIIEIDESGNVVNVVDVAPFVDGGKEKLKQLMRDAGWRVLDSA